MDPTREYAPIRTYLGTSLLGLVLDCVWRYWNAAVGVPEDASGILTHRSTNVSRWSGQKTPLGGTGKVQTQILALYLGTPVAGCWDVLFTPSAPLSTSPAPQRYPTNHPATWLHHPAAKSALRSTAVHLVQWPILGFAEDTNFCTYESPTKVHALEDGQW